MSFPAISWAKGMTASIDVVRGFARRHGSVTIAAMTMRWPVRTRFHRKNYDGRSDGKVGPWTCALNCSSKGSRARSHLRIRTREPWPTGAWLSPEPATGAALPCCYGRLVMAIPRSTSNRAKLGVVSGQSSLHLLWWVYLLKETLRPAWYLTIRSR